MGGGSGRSRLDTRGPRDGRGARRGGLPHPVGWPAPKRSARDLDLPRGDVLADLLAVVEVLLRDLRVVGAVLQLSRDVDRELALAVGLVAAQLLLVAVVLAEQLDLAPVDALALGRVDLTLEFGKKTNVYYTGTQY